MNPWEFMMMSGWGSPWHRNGDPTVFEEHRRAVLVERYASDLLRGGQYSIAHVIHHDWIVAEAAKMADAVLKHNQERLAKQDEEHRIEHETKQKEEEAACERQQQTRMELDKLRNLYRSLGLSRRRGLLQVQVVIKVATLNPEKQALVEKIVEMLGHLLTIERHSFGVVLCPAGDDRFLVTRRQMGNSLPTLELEPQKINLLTDNGDKGITTNTNFWYWAETWEDESPANRHVVFVTDRNDVCPFSGRLTSTVFKIYQDGGMILTGASGVLTHDINHAPGNLPQLISNELQSVVDKKKVLHTSKLEAEPKATKAAINATAKPSSKKTVTKK